MGLPKRKKDIKVYGVNQNTDGPAVTGRRKELLEEIIKSDTFLPDSILHDDLDLGMLEFVKENFKVISDGDQIPTIPKILTIQRWGEYTNNWSFADEDGNIKLPFIAVVRKPEVQLGTNPSIQRTIPDRRDFFYASVPTWDGNQMGADIYKIPQPIAVDISFDVTIVCTKFRDVNKFNQKVLQKFSSRQAYTKVKGHYIPIVLDRIEDNTPMDTLDGRRFYIQNYGFTMLGFLIDEEEFEVSPAVNRSITMIEPDLRSLSSNKQIDNSITISSNYNIGSIIADYTATANKKVDKTVEISFTDTLYTITGSPITIPVKLFIETNQISGTTEYTIDGDYNNLNYTNSFGSIEIDTIGKTKFSFDYTTGSTFNAPPTPTPTPSVTPSVTPSITPSTSITPTVTPSITPTVTPSITPSVTTSITPSITPSITSTETPTPTPSVTPSVTPSITPSTSITPSITPSETPTPTPTLTPTPTPYRNLLFTNTNTNGSTISSFGSSFSSMWDFQFPILGGNSRNAVINSSVTGDFLFVSITGGTGYILRIYENGVLMSGYTGNAPSTETYYLTQSIGDDGLLQIDLIDPPTPTPSVTPSITPSITESVTPTPSITPSITESVTPTPSITPSITESVTPSLTPSVTPSLTPTPSITESVTPSLTPSVTPSLTPSLTPSVTPSLTPSLTPTPSTPSNLIVYLDAGQNSSYPTTGSTWYDLAGVSNDATLLNTPTYSSSFNGIINFDDAFSEYATISDIGNLSTWTVEVWFRLTSSIGTKVSAIIANQYNGSNKLNFSIGTNNAPSNYQISVGFYDGSWHSTSGFAPSTNVWYQVVGTYDGSVIRQYINGVASGGTLNYVGTPQSGGEIRLMRRWDDVLSSSNLIDGDLSIVKIYNTSLNSSQVLQSYNDNSSRFT